MSNLRQREDSGQPLGSYVRQFAKAVLPPSAIAAMRQLRVKVLSHGLPRDHEFLQPPEQSHASASMSIIVPIHDAPIVTSRCLASLSKYAAESEVILVDDASRLAETREVIRDFSAKNGWRVIFHQEARGHSQACDAGARLASRPYICLLNSDTVVTPWCWLPLKEAFDRDTAIGVVGPSTSDSGNDQTLYPARHCRLCWDDSQICAYAEKLMRNPPTPATVDLPWISGFAFFIQCKLWQQLGGFDRQLRDYGNEQELCMRLTKMGYRAVWVRNSYIHHFGGQSYEASVGKDEVEARRLLGTIYLRQKHSNSVPSPK
jgi:GT2 family glycosyltransferase